MIELAKARGLVWVGMPADDGEQDAIPKAAGGWVSRAQFWQKALRPVLPKKLYHAAMQGIFNAYRYAIHHKAENSF